MKRHLPTAMSTSPHSLKIQRENIGISSLPFTSICSITKHYRISTNTGACASILFIASVWCWWNTVLCFWHNITALIFVYKQLLAGLGPKYSVLRYFGTRVPILQYSSVLSTHTFKKYLYSYLYSSTFKNKSTFNEYLRVLYEY